jgi:hypothetical protein
LQAVQEEAPAGDHVPGAHGVHVLPSPKVPGGHLPQMVLLDTLHAATKKYPLRHAVQAAHIVLCVESHAERT